MRKLPILVFLFFISQAFAEKAKLTGPDEKSMGLLKELVEINSGTENAVGLEKIRGKLIPLFKALGYQANTTDFGNGHKLVAFNFPEANPKVLLAGHLDTVFPKTSTFQKLSQDGDLLKGPGVMDMKGGIVMILNLLSDLDKDLRKQILIVLNDDEEIGSPHSKKKFDELAQGIPYGLVFEPALPDGNVISSASGVYWTEISVKGVAAHAGTDFQKGMNACVALSAKLVDIAKLTNFKKNLTVNLGTLEGGTKPNVVCETATAKLDIRYIDPDDLTEILLQINKIVQRKDAFNAALKEAPTAQTREIFHVPSLTSESSQQLLKRLQDVAKMLNIKLSGEHTAFASDANHLASTGIKLLVGMGAAGEGAHSEKETLDLSTYSDKLRLDEAFVKELITQP